MAKAHRISPEAIRDIARQIGEHISQVPKEDVSWWGAVGGRGALPVLGESFQIWTLGQSAAHSLRHGLRGIHPDQRLIEFAENTRHWHHQIRRQGGKAVALAHSMRHADKRGREHWTIEAIRASPVADAIDKAIKRIDEDPETKRLRNEVVRLLQLPGFSVHALWLEGPKADRILVAHQLKGRPRLSLRRFYSCYEFLDALARRERLDSAHDAARRSLPETTPRRPPRSSRPKRISRKKGAAGP